MILFRELNNSEIADILISTGVTKYGTVDRLNIDGEYGKKTTAMFVGQLLLNAYDTILDKLAKITASTPDEIEQLEVDDFFGLFDEALGSRRDDFYDRISGRLEGYSLSSR